MSHRGFECRMDWMSSDDASDSDDEGNNEFSLSWMSSGDWLQSEQDFEEIQHVETAVSPFKENGNEMQPFVVIVRDPDLDNMAKLRTSTAAKEPENKRQVHRNAKAFIRRLLEFMGGDDLNVLLKTDEVIKYCEANFMGHAIRNAFIYVTAAVKKCGAPESVIQTALEKYRAERRKYDEFRYGNKQGFSAYDSIFYKDNYMNSYNICQKEILILEKLLEGKKEPVDINTGKYMHSWASCTRHLGVMIAADNSRWKANRLDYCDLEFLKKTSRGYGIDHAGKKYYFSTKSGSILIRYSVLRKYINVKTEKVLVNLRGGQYKVRVIQEKSKRSSRVTCEVCGKDYPSRSHLNVHMRIHSGEKPFQCKICPAKFSDSSNLRGHMKTHPSEPGSESDSS